MPLEIVSMKEMQRIFEVTDRLGVHREAVVVPLGPRTPGRVRKRPDGKLEIVVDATDTDAFLGQLEAALQPLL